MIDLWFTEKHSEGAKFSIHVKEHLYSEKSPFQQIDFLIRTNLVSFSH